MRRETWEETGIEVGEVVYHSSQPWPGMVHATILNVNLTMCFDDFITSLFIAYEKHVMLS